MKNKALDGYQINFTLDTSHLLRLAKNKEFRKLFPGKSTKQIEEILIDVILKALDRTLR